jgi:uncharacterized protein YprB with RNaseH-like and TPR domain
MGQNLRARLGRIRAAKHTESKAPQMESDDGETDPGSASILPGWEQAGYKTLCRTVQGDLSFAAPEVLSGTLTILAPDFFNSGGPKTMPAPGDLLFFDLETTGLSGGAGTVAFLAAFGRFKKQKLEVTQYLLLDYPGESDFIEAVLKEFRIRGEAGGRPVVVSYNGKSFDSQILKTRCLMNGAMPPDFLHADLLHPARRLWKTCLPDCSQATIETQILGLDRTGDVSGAEAPEIWFNFLKTGETPALLDICEHNKKDICGLASLLIALADIANDPFDALSKYKFDLGNLALRWREVLYKRAVSFSEEEKKLAAELMQRAVKDGYQQASIVLYRALAIEAEWRKGDFREALAHTEAVLSLECITENIQADFIRRRERLLKKLGTPAGFKDRGFPQDVLNGN